MTKYLRKNGYWMYRCVRCHLVETDLQKEYGTFVKKFYTQGYYEGDLTRSAYISYHADKPYIVKNMRTFLSFIQQKKQTGKLLDVGCAFGYFVELALSKGYDAYGFDASRFAVREAEKLVGKSRVSEGTIQSVRFAKKSFDIITMFDVFEHLQDPLADMKKLASYLKDDGIIIIATGDTKSVAATVLRRKWTFYIPPQHIFFFHKKNATELLRQAFLKPYGWHTVGKWLSLGYVLHLARTTGESRIAGWVYDWLKKTPLMRLPLYVPMRDNMIIEVVKMQS